jgi:spermidine synthase
MKPTVLLDRATTPDGKPLTLHEHDGAYIIRVDGVELMSTRQHRSEEQLAESVCSRLGGRVRAARLLIGGLGLGFTLRAALARLGPGARVVVAELVPAVVRWNQTAEYGLAGDALADPRVELVVGDVADVLRRSAGGFDAVILDVDNGASGLSTAGNDRLYTRAGLATARAALRPGGCLAIWSAEDDPACISRMRQCGLDVVAERARAHAGGGGWNHLFIGVVPGRG